MESNRPNPLQSRRTRYHWLHLRAKIKIDDLEIAPLRSPAFPAVKTGKVSLSSITSFMAIAPSLNRDFNFHIGERHALYRLRAEAGIPAKCWQHGEYSAKQ